MPMSYFRQSAEPKLRGAGSSAVPQMASETLMTLGQEFKARAAEARAKWARARGAGGRRGIGRTQGR
jgi:hypothetical protein